MYILNFIPIKTGGGLQNVLSFLHGLEDKTNYLVFCRSQSSIEVYCQNNDILYVSVSSGFLSRLKFELKGFKLHVRRGDVCFTFFGPPMIGSLNYLYNISGCAYSNLFYKDIDFWGYLPKYKRLKKHLIDKYRLYFTSRSDEVIFETEELRNRAALMSEFKNCQLHVVKMAVSRLVSGVANAHDEFNLDDVSGYKFLFLCGAQPNKRVYEFIDILYELNKYGDFKIILTMDECSYLNNIMVKAQSLNLSNKIINLKTIQPQSVKNVVGYIDGVVNIARLESFSNNFIEAWAMKKLLIVADASWSRGCCEGSAVYIEPNDIIQSSIEILRGINDREHYVESGSKLLLTHPTPDEKNQSYYSIIERSR
ncbi:hypothetical protein ACPV5I_12395 [Vibrio gigantis]